MDLPSNHSEDVAYADRKMCVVVPRLSWQGDAALSRAPSSQPPLPQPDRPCTRMLSHTSASVSGSVSGGARLAVHHHSGERACLPRNPQADFIETNPARIGCRQPSAGWSPSGLSRPEPRPWEMSHSPEPHRAWACLPLAT